jgi:hypothetical protein
MLNTAALHAATRQLQQFMHMHLQGLLLSIPSQLAHSISAEA